MDSKEDDEVPLEELQKMCNSAPEKVSIARQSATLRAARSKMTL
jgi:hypothetical protein